MIVLANVVVLVASLISVCLCPSPSYHQPSEVMERLFARVPGAAQPLAHRPRCDLSNFVVEVWKLGFRATCKVSTRSLPGMFGFDNAGPPFCRKRLAFVCFEVS